MIVGHVLLLRPDKRPDFIALDALAGQVAEPLVLVQGAGAAHDSDELQNRVLLAPVARQAASMPIPSDRTVRMQARSWLVSRPMLA